MGNWRPRKSINPRTGKSRAKKLKFPVRISKDLNHPIPGKAGLSFGDRGNASKIKNMKNNPL
jgi:hypothetical protein